MEDIAVMLIDLALKRGADYCDVRYEMERGVDIGLRDGDIREVNASQSSGLGIRVLVDGAWGYASSNDLDRRSLRRATTTAVRLARLASADIRSRTELAPVKVERASVAWRAEVPPDDVSIEEKVKMLREMDRTARSVERVRAVSASHSDVVSRSEFYSSEGAAVRQEVVRCLVEAEVTVREGERTASQRMRIGATRGLEILDAEPPSERIVRTARTAVELLGGVRPPSGRYPLIADPELTGVFVHEAVGHAVEADAVCTHNSILEGMVGEHIAPSGVTIIDDPTLEGAFGSFPFDDEGVRGRRKVLIRAGELTAYICSRETAARLDHEPNGGARAESYSNVPLVRMSNTFMEGGDRDPEELFEGVKYGVYARGGRGGEVNTARGTFQFNANEAFLIEGGEVTRRLSHLSFSGRTLDLLACIDGISRDSQVGDPGFCVKGQWVPVGDGGPHIRVSDVVVGGG